MSRSLGLGLCAAGALAIAGCRQDGSYRVTWDFQADTTPGAMEQSAAAGCGQHGVDAIFVTASDTTGDGDQVLAICTLGQATRPVPAGTWNIHVQGVDAQRNLMPSVVPTASIHAVVVSDGVVSSLPPLVTLTFPPACSDGIDNDGDGRVDLDDPGCAGDPSGTHE